MASAAGPFETLNPVSQDPSLDGLFEVVGTQTVEKPRMGVFESALAGLLLEFLGPFARSNQLGQVFPETLFDLRPGVDRSRRPDLAFVSARKWPVNRRPPSGESWSMIPDLAVEVVSPANSAGQGLDKVREYLQAGVQLVWVIYPSAREIHVFDERTPSVVSRLQITDVLRGEPVLPDFELALTTLFGEGESRATTS
jgi:Uma2 family endonuclease